MLDINYYIVALVVAVILYSVYWTVTSKAKNKSLLTYITLWGGILFAIVGYLVYLIFTAQAVPVQ